MNRQERSWIFYDVGNSAFVLIMVTAIMPIFFKDHAAASLPNSISTAYWGFANSAASLTLALLAPLLGAMADLGQRKKNFFLFFLVLGLFFTSLLVFVGREQWLLCLALFFMARIGWAGANIFYDAFITDVTTPERVDMISAKGYGYGYIGSVLPFLGIIALLLLGGIEGGLPVFQTKAGFIIVVLWWLLFSLPLLFHVQQRAGSHKQQQVLFHSLVQLFSTIKNLRQQPMVLLFLAAYFFYIDGVGTIISMSTAYGRDLGFGIGLLITVLLFIQIIAFPFALLYGRLAAKFSAKKMILFGIIIYISITLLGFMLPSVTNLTAKSALFWIMAFLVASSMGGIQALSRSLYSRLIPDDRACEYFGFYNIFGKFAAICGPFLMGVITTVSGDSRWGVLAIALLFIAGGVLLARVKE